MRISGQDTTNNANNVNNVNARRPENVVRSTDVSRTRSSEGVEQNNEVSSTDRVELSSQARDIQRAREVAQQAPEIRANRVEEARRTVQNDSLNLNGQVLANRLLQNVLPG